MIVGLIYNLLLLLAGPLLAVYLAYRVVIKGKSREGFLQRLGGAPLLPRPGPGGRVWMHAVSAGEMVAAAAIARRLRETAPDTEIVVSTTTPAGRQQADKLIPEATARFYFPFDFLPCVTLALLRVRPTAIAAVETEIWPNWLWLSHLLGIRAALVNGQFTDRGFRGARKARLLYRWALGHLAALRMQSAQAAERALWLGAPPERVRVTGSVKFEQQIAPLRPEVEAAIRRALDLDGGRPLFLAGSTHPGEEEQVLEAFQAARRRVPALALLLAPRHIERAGEVSGLLAARGLKSVRRTALEADPAARVDVLLLDTMGELAGTYALANVVFVGGSLVPIGGHDILQPLFHGKAVLFGPHMHNQHDLAALALAEGAAVQVSDAADLAAQIERLCLDPVAAEALRTAGARLVERNSGAARECADLLAELARRAGDA